MTHVIGDSHSSFFLGRDEIAKAWPEENTSNLPGVTVHYLGPAIAAALNMPASPHHEPMQNILSSLLVGSRILLVFGEIDCRATSTPYNGHELPVGHAAQKYLEVIKTLQRDYDVWVWGVHSPAYDDERRRAKFPAEIREKREVATHEWNAIMAGALGERYLCIQNKVQSNPEYFMDGLHLAQTAMPFARAVLGDLI